MNDLIVRDNTGSMLHNLWSMPDLSLSTFDRKSAPSGMEYQNSFSISVSRKTFSTLDDPLFSYSRDFPFTGYHNKNNIKRRVGGYYFNSLGGGALSTACTLESSTLMGVLDAFSSKNLDVADSQSINPQAIEDANFFALNNIRRFGLSFPLIRVIPDGEVNFLWNTERVVLDVAIFGDKTFSFYSKDNESGVEHYEDRSISGYIDEPILKLLRLI